MENLLWKNARNLKNIFQTVNLNDKINLRISIIMDSVAYLHICLCYEENKYLNLINEEIFNNLEEAKVFVEKYLKNISNNINNLLKEEGK